MQTISALRINEVELNPAGTDSGNEWIELYSEEEINLSGYKLVNNDGDEINLEGNFSGYYTYIFGTQWLDNSDEKIFLYKNDELIDESNLLDDGKNDERAWSYCSGSEWEFIESTEKARNGCEEEQEEIGDEPENTSQEQDEQNKTESFEETNGSDEEITESKNITPEVIRLNPKAIEEKVIKTEDDKEELEKSQYAMYGFLIFCILLVVLLTLKKKRSRKNEGI